ncbi:peptidase domain-containing ABC transporter [Geobacillus thermodenitrificans]|uniref:peptidase domain-containing ABC transporter n=1 Tax=Geobacillus thermodenitrificans TaxID=33940 RepID=UPI0034C5E267
MKDRYHKFYWLWPFFAPYRWILFIVFVLSLVTTVADLSYPYFSKILVDHVLIEQKYSLKSVVLLITAIVVFSIIVQTVNSYVYLYVTLNVMKRMKVYFFHKLERLPYEFFVRTKIGDITNRLNNDLNIVQGTLTDGLVQLMMSAFHLLFITVILIYLNWQLFVVTLVIFPILIWAVVYFRPKLVQKTKEIRNFHGQIQSHIIETFGYIRSIKLLQAEKERAEGLDQKIGAVNTLSLRYALLETIASGIPRMATMMMALVVLLIGGMKVLDGTLTVGSLLAFTTYLNRFFAPVQTMAGLYIQFQTMLVSLERIADYLHLPSEDDSQQPLPRLEGVNEKAMFKLIGVGKQIEKGRELFRDVSIAINPNCSYALVGKSGIGKSVFVDLLVRLTKLSQGMILFQGISIDRVPISDIRRRVVVIPQEVEIIHDTVKANLLLGLSEDQRKRVGDHELFQVCQQVGLHEEIQTFPNQYDTVIGEKGKRFSGGQKQRLAIARGLLRDPSVLILDEATSGLDLEAEREVFARLDAWRRAQPNRTLIVVSHRIASLDWVERYLVIQNGAIVEMENYEEMIRTIGFGEDKVAKGEEREWALNAEIR